MRSPAPEVFGRHEPWHGLLAPIADQGNKISLCDGGPIPLSRLQALIGGFVVKIDGNSPVFARLAGCGSHSHPQVRWSMQLVTKGEGNASLLQEDP
jgi:hypothetical protein